MRKPKGAYQRRLAIWLTEVGPFAAHRVAEFLAISTQAVWKWLGEYNALGPQGLERHGRGGRRRASPKRSLRNSSAPRLRSSAASRTRTTKGSRSQHCAGSA